MAVASKPFELAAKIGMLLCLSIGFIMLKRATFLPTVADLARAGPAASLALAYSSASRFASSLA